MRAPTKNGFFLAICVCLFLGGCPNKQAQTDADQDDSTPKTLPEQIIHLGKTPERVKTRLDDINKRAEEDRKKFLDSIEK
ncbi:MAG: hypothetical protein R3A11_09830 [Bdellovibrionota bacterium]